MRGDRHNSDFNQGRGHKGCEEYINADGRHAHSQDDTDHRRQNQ